MKKLTTSEKVLDYIIKLMKEKGTTQYYIYDTIIEKTQLNEKDIIQSLYFLQDDNSIEIIENYSHDDFSTPFLIELTSSGKNYFKKKEEIRKEKRDKWIQVLITIGISFLTFIITLISVLLSL